MNITIVVAIIGIVVTLLIFIIGIVLTLIGIIYSSLTKRLTKLEDNSITKTNCDQCGKNQEDKVDALTKMFDLKSDGVMDKMDTNHILGERLLKELERIEK